MTVDYHRGSNGVGNDKLYGDAVHDRLDGSRATISLNTCPKGMGTRFSRLLHIALPSASRGWRRAVCALAAALPLLLGAGGVAAQDTLPTVSVSDAEAYEDGRFVHFEVSLSQASGEPVTVEVATSSGTARSGTDFRAVLQTVTFPARSTDPQSVLVSLRNDRTPEPDETFTVTLRNPVGATLGDAMATGTIRNDDSAATLAASSIGETSATLTIGGHTGGWWYKGGEYSLGPPRVQRASVSHSSAERAFMYGGCRRHDGGQHRRSHGSEVPRLPGLQRQHVQHEAGQGEVPDPCAGGYAHGERVRCRGLRGRRLDGLHGVAVAS